MQRRLLIGALVAIASRMWADEPLGPPSRISHCSPHRQFCAVADPKRNAVVVYRGGDRRTERWTLEPWERSFDIADDGDHMIVCYSGMNLLPLDYKPAWVMLRFYNRRQLVREWTLRELLPDLKKLERTVSHYEWGQCVGFDSNGSYEVETVDRGKLRFDVRTGSLVK